MNVKLFKYSNTENSSVFCSVDFPEFWIPTIDWVDDFIDKHRGLTMFLEEWISESCPKEYDRIPQGAHLVYPLHGNSPIKYPTKGAIVKSFYSLPYHQFMTNMRFDGSWNIEKEFKHCMTVSIPKDLRFIDIYKTYYNSWAKQDIFSAFCTPNPGYLEIYYAIYYLTTMYELRAQGSIKT